MPRKQSIEFAEKLKSVMSEEFINELGREEGQSQRLRIVTPFRLVIALLSTLCGGRMDALADFLRTFNHQNQTKVAYKAFYNRLCRPAFARFCRQLCSQLLQTLSVRVFDPDDEHVLSRFSDIVIQDGTSFGIKRGVPKHFAGGTSPWPLARLHVTLSGFRKVVERAVLTGDKIAERCLKISPKELCGKLFLADRGYASIAYFSELVLHGASFCIRLPRSYKPKVVAYYQKGLLVELARPTSVHEIVKMNPQNVLDLVIRWPGKNVSKLFRLVVFPSKEIGGTWICTHLDPREFPPAIIGKLYRFRWQIELLFKEWKSHANLHRWGTKNPHIIEGLIWASLATATLMRVCTWAAQPLSDKPLSTLRAAKAAREWLKPILLALLKAPQNFLRFVRPALRFLAHCVPRANPKRDRISGSLTLFEAP